MIATSQRPQGPHQRRPTAAVAIVATQLAPIASPPRRQTSLVVCVIPETLNAG